MAALFLSRHPHSLHHFSTSSNTPLAFSPEIRRLAKLRLFSAIESLLEPLKLHPPTLSSPEPHLAAIISSYASSSMLDHALRTLHQLPQLNSPRTLLSLNALLSACNRSPSLSPRVPSLLSSLSLSLHLPPNPISYGILLKSLSLSRNSPQALLVLAEMRQKGIEITATSHTTVMYSLYKDGLPEEAERVWGEMRAPDVAAYNVRAMHMAGNGEVEGVLGLMEEMRARGMEPDVFTYNYLMSCYCRVGMVEEAKRVYRGLEGNGCRANGATWKNLVYGLCENGDFVGGVEVFEDCFGKGRVVDLGTVMRLVKGLVKGSKVRAARRVVVGLRSRFPEEFKGSWKKLEGVVGLNKDVVVAEVGNS